MKHKLAIYSTITQLLLILSIIQLPAQTGHRTPIQRVLVSGDEKRLVSISTEQLRIWTFPGLRPLHEFTFSASTSEYEVFALDHDGSKLLQYFGQTNIHSLDRAKVSPGGQPGNILSLDNTNKAHFSTDTRRIHFFKTAGKTAVLCTIDLDNPSVIREFPEISAKSESVRSLFEFKPGHFLYEVGDSGNEEVYFHRIGEKKPYFKLELKQKTILVSNLMLSEDRESLMWHRQIYDLRGDLPVSKETLNADKEDRIELEWKLKKVSTGGRVGVSLSEGRVYGFKGISLYLRTDPVENARNFAKLNMTDSAFHMLKIAMAQPKKPNLAEISRDPDFVTVVGDARWTTLINSDKHFSPADKLAFQGQELLQNNSHTAALEAFEKALGLEPKNPTALEGKATTLSILKRTEEAGQTATQCLITTPESLTCMLILAESLEKAGKLDEAADQYKKVATVDHTQFHLFLRIARMYEKSDPSKVIMAVNAYLDKHPRDADGLALIAKAYRKTDRFADAARAYYDLAQGTVADADYGMATDSWLKAGKPDEAKLVISRWEYINEGSPLLAYYRNLVNQPPSSRQEDNFDDDDRGKQKVNRVPPDPNAVVCGTCRGSGKNELKCNICFGKGSKTCTRCGGRRFAYNYKGESSYCGGCSGQGVTSCYSCGGRGYSPYRPPCPSCGGRGYK